AQLAVAEQCQLPRTGGDRIAAHAGGTKFYLLFARIRALVCSIRRPQDRSKKFRRDVEVEPQTGPEQDTGLAEGTRCSADPADRPSIFGHKTDRQRLGSAEAW